ncbi:lantibiotic dehydratase C-terminal domain-containing protein [Glycomyces tenuis]|uniref:lantibiotic dehydratase C-terminal domain-containing protein n=1 Tax=Glycomyces tenuis TaxID=58116 RepID=UPI00041A74DF|nr:lantibiotic dehydratase C-terminal domain-containing protein [Glycomyces tenuis]
MNLSRASLAVAYHAPVKRRFVAAVLLPAAERLRRAEGVTHVHIARHWRFGPHLQLIASGPDHGDQLAALDAERAAVEAGLRRHGSAYELNVDGYLETSKQLGAAELIPPPYEPIWPDNTVRRLDRPLEPGLIENPDALDLRDAFNEAMLEPIGHIAAAAEHSRSARLQGAFTFMVLLAATYPDLGLLHGSLSYKSHLEDHLQDHDPEGTLRADFEARYRPVRPVFEALVQSLIDDPLKPGYYEGGDPVWRQWARSLRRCWDRALELAEAHAIEPYLHQGYAERSALLNDHLRRKYAVGDDREYSEFHAALRAADYTDPVGGRWFAAYRFMVNLLYAQLLVLDVSPAERLFLAHAASESVASITGVTWRQILTPDENAEAAS